MLRSGKGWISWGTIGNGLGQFVSPRAIGASGEEVYVADKTGRIQVFDLDGKFVRYWNVPEAGNGTPTSIAFDLDGNVLIPDTHYSRILEYTSTGELLHHWGEYGNGQDQFIYPTGIVQLNDGRYYVSEYGEEAERVHGFDTERKFYIQWGQLGVGPGEFRRLMDIASDGQRLFVVDTGNHRIQCFDPEGHLVEIVGEEGTGEGQLKFPHDMDIAPDGSLYIAEYGNSRISRFAPDGRFLGCYGSPGRKSGQLNAPRGIAVADNGYVFVTDTDNHRIVRFEA